MELSKRTQTIIALFSGIVLGALLVIAFMQGHISNMNDSASTATQQSKTDQTQAVNTKPKEETATEQTTPAATSTSSQQANPPTTTTNNTYDYIAQPGDSYSILARKAVQTYGIIHNIRLSAAQIIAAESQLTDNAGSPELNEDQQVNINVDDVKSAVETVQKMSSDEIAMWQTYTYGVDFNTNDNG